MVHALFIGLLTNTLMYVFMSAVINNDSMSFPNRAGMLLFFVLTDFPFYLGFSLSDWE